MGLQNPNKNINVMRQTRTKSKYKQLIKQRLTQIKNGVFRWIPRYLLRKLSTVLLNKPKGVDVMEEDWDTLVVLDACRYDAFTRVVPFLPWEGTLEKKISQGSNTPQWLNKNFGEETFDAVYVSGNPWVSHNNFFNPCNHFISVKAVWKDHWNEKYGTVLAEDVTESALEIRKQYPHTRMIVHYLQPHHPFIGKTKLYGETNIRDVWNHENIKKAWMDNLLYVLKQVFPLITEENGKIVLTADHGDSFRLIGGGHTYATYLPELIEVPWYVIDKRTTRQNIREKIEEIKEEI